MNYQLTFVLTKTTKGAHQYTEVDAQGNQLKGDAGVLNSIYIRKAALDNGSVPQKLAITVKGE